MSDNKLEKENSNNQNQDKSQVDNNIPEASKEKNVENKEATENELSKDNAELSEDTVEESNQDNISTNEDTLTEEASKSDDFESDDKNDSNSSNSDNSSFSRSSMRVAMPSLRRK